MPRAARLTRTGEFGRVRREGQSWPGRFLTVAVLVGAERGPSRIGFITPRHIGSAVERNRVRRRLREMVRLSRPLLKADRWIVLVGKRGAALADSAGLRDEWRRLADRAGLWRAAP